MTNSTVKNQMSIDLLKKELLETIKKCYKLSLMAGTSGNGSCYHKESKNMIITASGVDYETMTPEDMVVMKLDGIIVSGDKEPSSEWRMHAQVYMERNDITSILHTHSPYATGFAVCHENIPVILVEMVPFLGGDVPVAEFGIPGTAKVGVEALKVLKNRKACMLANHGTIAIGESLERTLLSSIYLEDAAKIYHIAKNAGEVKVISSEMMTQSNNVSAI